MRFEVDVSDERRAVRKWLARQFKCRFGRHSWSDPAFSYWAMDALQNPLATSRGLMPKFVPSATLECDNCPATKPNEEAP